ncbi:MAG: hypothetical protein KKH21_06165 [Gammaproteobacteria bacterium]|nr:hypothetical protein [Gammaproteobacteria bacterium]MBU0828479.1 hypothetical protein [Gammaproteobacteria bacterium]MBU0890463.1 hypothetical protein [Gammaproteobacteria bacterium]
MSDPNVSVWNSIARHSFLFFVVVVAIFALHPSIWHASWRFDDPQMLEFAANQSIVESFYKPNVWKELGAPFFTPLLTLSYWIDHQIFGLDPWGYYLHQVAAMALAVMLSYAKIKDNISAAPFRKAWAAICGILFISGMPAFVVTEQVMTRHYIEGLCLALISFHLHQRGTRVAIIFSALFYLLAILAKEIYIPLPFILFYTHWSRDRETTSSLTRVAWHGFFLALYALWRVYMLNGIGGYSSQLIPSLEQFLNFLEAGISIVFFDGVFGVVAAAIIFTYVLKKKAEQNWSTMYLLSVAALSALPLLPAIASIPSDMGTPYFIFHRYFFLPWWLLCMALIHAGIPASQSRMISRIGLQYAWLAVLATLTLSVVLASIYDSKKRGCFEAWATTSEDWYLSHWHSRSLLGEPPPPEVLPYLHFMGKKIDQLAQRSMDIPPDVHGDRLLSTIAKIHSRQTLKCKN